MWKAKITNVNFNKNSITYNVILARDDGKNIPLILNLTGEVHLESLLNQFRQIIAEYEANEALAGQLQELTNIEYDL